MEIPFFPQILALSFFLIRLMTCLCLRFKISEVALTLTEQTQFSGSVFAEFQLVTEDFWPKEIQQMPNNNFELELIPTHVLYDCLDGVIPIVTGIINKSLTSGISPQCLKHALV